MNQKFRAGVNRQVAMTQEVAQQLVRKTLIDMAGQIVAMSPVDTGRFRANWMFGRGAIDFATSDATDPGASQTQQRLTREINAGVTFGQSEMVYITNSLPYAFKLEYEGWSGQAPGGMVRVTVGNFGPTIRAVSAAIRGVR